MVENPIEALSPKEEATANGVMKAFADPMRSRIWGMLVAESPLTSAQILRRLNQSDTGATQRKLIPYSSISKYLTDLSSLGLVEIDDQLIRGRSAYRVNDESVRMYEIAQQEKRQLVEVIRSRPDPQVVRIVKNLGREGLLLIARELAKRDPEAYQAMVQELIQDESALTK